MIKNYLKKNNKIIIYISIIKIIKNEKAYLSKKYISLKNFTML